MVTLTDSLRRVKHHLADILPDRVIQRACCDVGHAWRDRQLDPTVTTYLLLQQVLLGNAAAGELRRHCGLGFTDSAYCQARQRLPLAVLWELQREENWCEENWCQFISRLRSPLPPQPRLARLRNKIAGSHSGRERARD